PPFFPEGGGGQLPVCISPAYNLLHLERAAEVSV
ncbi:unnamed protein product, partial [marine sediment metagenome]